MRILRPVLIIALAGLSLPFAVLAAPGGAMPQGPTMRELTPQEIAKESYNEGVRAVKQAKKYEDDAAQATRDDKKAKAAEKARKQYDKSRNYFLAAVARQRAMHEAWNYIGYTSRKLGEYDKALSAYDEALRLNPSYAEAIEYRGVAYLALNRTADAQTAYMRLFRDDRKLADQLMQEMQHWLADRRDNPAGLQPADIDAFAQWVNDRATIAQQTASLAVDAPSTRWQ